MRRITKGNEPSTFATYRREAGATFGSLPSEEKEELRESLVKEQGGLCCYCMCRIPEVAGKYPGMKIEHFKSQSRYPSEQLVYRNLFGACWGNGQGNLLNGSHPQTCDTFRSKKNEDIKSFNLLTSDLELEIRYLRNGTMQSQRDDLNDEIKTILNLNDQSLCGRREGVRDGVSNQLRKLDAKGKVAKKVIQKLIDDFKSRDKDGNFKEFYPVAVYHLETKLKQYK